MACNRTNVEGKPVEQLIYLAGVDVYDRVTSRVLKDGDAEWEGFDVIQDKPRKGQGSAC